MLRFEQIEQSQLRIDYVCNELYLMLAKPSVGYIWH